MAARQQSAKVLEPLPMLKTVEQMSKLSGLGENKLRNMMESGEVEYIQIGNRRLLADAAIWDWYERNKRKVEMKRRGRKNGSPCKRNKE